MNQANCARPLENPFDVKEKFGSYEIFLEGDRLWCDFKIGEEHIQDGMEIIVEGFIKWDGCMQFKSDVHIDVNIQLEELNSALLHIRVRAKELMGSEDID